MASGLSKLSIRWILPAAVVVPVFAVALTLTVLAYKTGQHNANDLAGQSIRQIHERIESHLNHLMDLPPAINRFTRARLEANILSLDDPGKNRKLLFETLQAFPDVSGLVLGSAGGQAVWVIRYPGETSYEYAVKSSPDALMEEWAMSAEGQIGASPIRTSQYNTLIRPWYRAAVEANTATWGNVYLWVRGGKGVTLGVPYAEPYHDAKGTLLGVINSEITLADISVFLKKLQIGKTGLAFIIERDGNLIATSLGIDCMKDGTGRLSASEAPDPRITAAMAQIPKVFGSLDAIDGVHLDHVDINGQPTQMVISDFRNRRNLNWLVVTLVPDSDFLAEVNRARNRSMLIGTAAVFGALALGFFLALWLLKPILAVVAHARRVGEGDLDARITRHDNREITQLSTALNEMAAGLQDRMRLRHALSLAMEVQQSLLPAQTPKIKGLDVAARSKYCDETGGDYYDYLDVENLGPNSMMIAMGDVTGHGIAAAMLMATARGVLRSQVNAAGSLGKLLTHVNQHLAADTGGTRFMTMFLAVVDISTMSMRWATAGHDQPLIYDPQTGFTTEIDANAGGLPLGVIPDEVYDEFTHADLRPGQVMLIGTDGLWESRNNSGQLFGKERVGEALKNLAHLSAAEIEAGIFRVLQEFCDGRANDDDITYIVIKFTGPVI